MKQLIVLIFPLVFMTSTAFGEYRAYLIEVYDHIAEFSWEATTGFSPDKYILTHGGGNRLTARIKATWHCHGDTSRFAAACPMPEPIEPKFKKGDRVKVNLKKHVTEGWVGIVSLSLYRRDLKSNVYGVEFGADRKLYNRYYEFNLEKTDEQPAGLPANENPTDAQTAPAVPNAN